MKTSFYANATTGGAREHPNEASPHPHDRICVSNHRNVAAISKEQTLIFSSNVSGVAMCLRHDCVVAIVTKCLVL